MDVLPLSSKFTMCALSGKTVQSPTNIFLLPVGMMLNIASGRVLESHYRRFASRSTGCSQQAPVEHRAPGGRGGGWGRALGCQQLSPSLRWLLVLSSFAA